MVSSSSQVKALVDTDHARDGAHTRPDRRDHRARSMRPSTCGTVVDLHQHGVRGHPEIVDELANDLRSDLIVIAQELGQQIHTRHDANDVAVGIDDWQAFQIVPVHQASGIAHARPSVDRDGGHGHQVAGDERLRLATLLHAACGLRRSAVPTPTDPRAGSDRPSETNPTIVPSASVTGTALTRYSRIVRTIC